MQSNARIPFVIHASGWVLMAAVVACGTKDLGLADGITAALIVIMSLLTHEFAHVFGACILDVPVYEFGLKFIGAYTRRKHARRRRHEIAIAAAGPLTSLFLMVTLFFVPRIGPWLAAWNFGIAMLNLAPFPRTDGHRMVKTMFWPDMSIYRPACDKGITSNYPADADGTFRYDES